MQIDPIPSTGGQGVVEGHLREGLSAKEAERQEDFFAATSLPPRPPPVSQPQRRSK